MFYDIHAHLSDKVFSTDREGVIGECNNKNIVLFETGLDYESNEESLKLSMKYSNVRSCMGMHPTVEFDERVINQIIDNKDRIVGIGEVGLDYKCGAEGQEEAFKKMVKLAEELKLPLIVHSRRAHSEVLDIIENIAVPVILHAFSANKKNLGRALSLKNVFLSIPANVAYDELFQNIVKEAPINKLFCETDSPYLWKLGRNTPLMVLESYNAIAKIKNLPLKEVESEIEANIKRLFHRI